MNTRNTRYTRPFSSVGSAASLFLLFVLGGFSTAGSFAKDEHHKRNRHEEQGEMAASTSPSSRKAVSAILSGKKGLGLVEKDGLGGSQLAALGVAWFYNWGAQTQVPVPPNMEYVPMVFSQKGLSASSYGPLILGFNEPDNAKQSNISVAEALAAWPQVVARGQRVGGPAMAGDPVGGVWLPAFMQAHPKVDFITVHWYKGANAKKFIRDIEGICQAYEKPLWITEFAPQTASQGREHPDKYSVTEVVAFIQDVTVWMNQSPCVERFAWHDAKEGSSALFDAKGELTETGRAYAKAP